MKNIILIGSGGHSRPIISVIQSSTNFDLKGVIDIHYKDNNKEKILGIPVIGPLSILEKYKNKEMYVFLTIGDNKLRKEISENQLLNNFTHTNIVHPLSNVDKSAKLGLGNYVGPFANIGPEVKLGFQNIVNTNVDIEHETKIGNFCHLAPNSTIGGRCIIGNQILIGANATILEKKRIADKTIIGASSFVNKDVLEPNQTLVGSPCKPI